MRKAKAASILLFVISLVLFLYCIFVREGGQDQSGPQIQINQQEIQVRSRKTLIRWPAM